MLVGIRYLILGNAIATPMSASLDQWTWRNPLPQANDLLGVTYGNGVFVADTSGDSIDHLFASGQARHR